MPKADRTYVKYQNKYYRLAELDDAEIDKPTELASIDAQLVRLGAWKAQVIQETQDRYQSEKQRLNKLKNELNNLP